MTLHYIPCLLKSHDCLCEEQTTSKFIPSVLALKSRSRFILHPLIVFVLFQPLEDAVVGKELTVKITFQNPLSQVLKNVLFRIEGLGMQSVRKIEHG